MFSEAEQSGAGVRPRKAPDLGDANHGVCEQTWERARKHYDDGQLVALVALISLINATNRLSGGSLD